MSDGFKANFKRKRELLVKLRKLAPAVDKELRKAIIASAKDVQDTAKSFVPVDQGDLRDGLTYVIQQKGFAARVGIFDSKLFYATFVEFGTAKTSAQPFLFPAYRVNLKKIKGKISRAINKSVKQVIK